MVQTAVTLPEAAFRPSVTIDVIGDLDSTLAASFTETLAGLGASGAAVVVNFKHVAIVHSEGFNDLARAISAARVRGTSIAVSGRTRRIKSLFATARIACEEPETGLARGRHIMLARHG